MSTFDGVVQEFPQIRIDFFRPIPGRPPPLACFLSHVHSDHLQGLESLKAPFVYCSPATRQMLLRLEKYPHRMNFAKGILESRVQTYRHLGKLLKTIPLETPTTIELAPSNQIRVTLFDANHCPGSVMFLLQGDAKAVLYTGDIRSESWWVNALVQNPFLLPYTLGSRRLDKIYLDTTFATKIDIYREFPSKAEGVRELLEKVDRYPSTTTFHFQSWTFGYENVWLALSEFLRTPIHLDPYRWEIYSSLRASGDLPECREAPPLCGFRLGNHQQEGCLTTDQTVRLHSCERGHPCPVFGPDKTQHVVQIIPIVTRTRDGTEIAEVGAGGGKGDLDQSLELEIGDRSAVQQLVKLCEEQLEGRDPSVLEKTLALLHATSGEHNAPLSLVDGLKNANALGTDTLDRLPLQNFIDVLATIAKQKTLDDHHVRNHEADTSSDTHPRLPKTITFPYSRHSSYSELCELVGAFRPKDIHPCTVDVQNWKPTFSMQHLFGHLCSGTAFEHDVLMFAVHSHQDEASVEAEGPHQTPETQRSWTDYERSSHQTALPSPPNHLEHSQPLSTRELAYYAALGTRGFSWADFGGLISAGNNHAEQEVEL